MVLIKGGQFSASQFSMEYRSLFSTFGLTMANPNFVKSSGIFVGHYLRRITERHDMGAEYVQQLDQKIPGNIFIVFLLLFIEFKYFKN